MSDQQNVEGSWDQENHGSNYLNNDGSVDQSPEERRKLFLSRCSARLHKELTVMGRGMEALVGARRTVLKQAMRIGRLLVPIREAIGHGNWRQWLATEMAFKGVELLNERVARNYMSLARERHRIKRELNSDSTITDALRLIRKRREQPNPQGESAGVNDDYKEAEIEIPARPVDTDQTLARDLAAPAKLIFEPASKVGMYSASVKQWNVFAGCGFECNYCTKSFQLQLKRQMHRCEECYDYSPHSHPERLDASLPRTGPFEFIFTCSHGDISFCDDAYFGKILARISKETEKTFLLQSKSPKKAFDREGIVIPRNVILGTTIETNRAELCRRFTNAPPPELRFRQLRDLDHPCKMVTIEPVMVFDLDVMVQWIAEIKPKLVWLGYDSKNCGLVEPTQQEFQALLWELAKLGVAVILKKSEPNILKGGI